MATKKTGISPDLLIPPGETIADVLEDRGMTQKELANKTGLSPAYISDVIAGKQDISADFAYALERVFDVPKSFWMNLQAHYDEECREVFEHYFEECAKDAESSYNRTMIRIYWEVIQKTDKRYNVEPLRSFITSSNQKV